MQFNSRKNINIIGRNINNYNVLYLSNQKLYAFLVIYLLVHSKIV